MPPIVQTMAFVLRYPISLAVVLLAVAAAAGVFVFARPQYREPGGVSIKLPAKQPADDAPGAAGWVWPETTPGWEAGRTIKGFNISGVQPVEIQAAQLAAARYGLDASKVRVFDALRANRTGALAILAAPNVGQTPALTCLAALLPGDAPVLWRCPGSTDPPDVHLARSHVLVAATLLDLGPAVDAPMLFLVGVARGDVHRIVLHAPGLQAPETVYTRGTTWGQFDAVFKNAAGHSRLDIFGRNGLAETLRLNLVLGQQRVFP